jgi:3-deoxy-7-phosphoheptulonate synthase
MIVVMNTHSGSTEVDHVLTRLKELGLTGHLSQGEERCVIGVVGHTFPELRDMLEGLPGVEEVVPISKPYKLTGREFQPADTVFQVGDVRIGGGETVVMAGPCAIESEDQLLRTAEAVRAAGAHILRGGAFKPRTSPYTFRGLEEEGLKYLAKAREATGMPVITEVMSAEDVPLVAEYADILQIGARNMQNFFLLDAAGRARRPVLLKRGLSATLQEWLLAAEYILAQGNPNVILCERGIRTFETYTRNTMDLAAVPLVHHLSHLPVIVDPSHATGKRWLVAPLAMGGVAVGADGVMVEVHPDPDAALSDAEQQLTFDQFRAMMSQLVPVHDQVRGLRDVPIEAPIAVGAGDALGRH